MAEAAEAGAGAAPSEAAAASSPSPAIVAISVPTLTASVPAATWSFADHPALVGFEFHRRLVGLDLGEHVAGFDGVTLGLTSHLARVPSSMVGDMAGSLISVIPILVTSPCDGGHAESTRQLAAVVRVGVVGLPSRPNVQC